MFKDTIEQMALSWRATGEPRLIVTKRTTILLQAVFQKYTIKATTPIRSTFHSNKPSPPFITMADKLPEGQMPCYNCWGYLTEYTSEGDLIDCRICNGEGTLPEKPFAEKFGLTENEKKLIRTYGQSWRDLLK